MAEFMRSTASIGWVGVLCLAVYGLARVAPEIADRFALSSFGKFAVLGALLLGVLLTAIAALKGSRWWLVAVVGGGMALVDIYLHSRVLR